MPADLNSLIAEATRCAHFTMKMSGSLALMTMDSTEQGLIQFTQDSLSDTGDATCTKTLVSDDEARRLPLNNPCAMTC